MALASYTDLTGSVANWLARTDLTASIPDCVTLFESRFNRTTRVRQMEAAVTLTPDANGELVVPTDFLEFRRLTQQTSPLSSLDYVNPVFFQTVYPYRDTGTQANIFTIEGSAIKTMPLSTTDCVLEYYAALTPLSAAVSGTNWLMSDYPDIYLSGTLSVAYTLQKDKDNATFWGNILDRATDELTRLDSNQKAPSAIQVMGPTP